MQTGRQEAFSKKIIEGKAQSEKNASFRQTSEKFSSTKSSWGSIHLGALMKAISEMQLWNTLHLMGYLYFRLCFELAKLGEIVGENVKWRS